MNNLYFPICAVLINLLIIIVFNSKKRIDTDETKIYSFLINIGTIESILACILVILMNAYGIPPYIYNIHRIDYILMLTWVWGLFYYVVTLLFQKGITKQRIKTITTAINVIASISFFFLRVNVVNSNGIIDTNGPAMNLLFGMLSFYIVLMIILITYSIICSKINHKKLIPIFVLGLFAIVALVIRSIAPEILIVSLAAAYADLIMYFTIENPDVKMVNELELAKNQAEKANRAKTDFLSSMSHEIRTPLNAIVGLSNIIKDSNDLEEIHEDASDVVNASNTLLEIVNGILDISRIEADKMEIVEVSYNPLEEFNSLVNLTKTRIGEKGIEFRNEFAVDLPETLYGDKSKVKQIITNLLSNAVKYTEKGYIDFKVSCINERDISKLTITVSDTGRGIKKEQMDNLFTKFNRLEEDKNTTIEGTGLGLAITKSLVEMMGGKIVVDSTYGEGTKFTVFLSQKITNNETLEKIETINTFDGKKVLVVDDNKLNIKVASKILKEFNLDIDECESGFECINRIKNNNKYDIIFMDIMMPKMSGTETLKKLKQIENFNTPVIALTADALEGKSNKYLEVGFTDYLSKPINKIELNNVLNKILNNIKSEEKANMHEVISITDQDVELLNKKIENDKKTNGTL